MNATIIIAAFMDGFFFGSLGLLYGISFFGLIIPYFAVSVRRLHDSNKSGWWFLIALVPFGAVALLVMFLLPSYPYPNQYEYHSL